LGWFDISIAGKKAKWKVLNEEEKEYPYCDSKGNALKKVAGSFTKGYFFNETTGEKIDKAFRLINGKANAGFTGRTKEIKAEQTRYIPINEIDDLLVSKTGIMICEELYKELTEKKQALKTGLWVGNGYKGWKTLIYPSPIYKDVLMVKMGISQLSDRISTELSDLEETQRLKNKLKDIELQAQAVDKAKVEDLISLD
jgi:hypothetical protein